MTSSRLSFATGLSAGEDGRAVAALAPLDPNTRAVLRCPRGKRSRADSEQKSLRRVSKKMPRPKRLEHSVYLGRERLGRYVKAKRKPYTAFDANNRVLGRFRTRAKALMAIRTAWEERP
jgi:hypothetical protein